MMNRMRNGPRSYGLMTISEGANCSLPGNWGLSRWMSIWRISGKVRRCPFTSIAFLSHSHLETEPSHSPSNVPIAVPSDFTAETPADIQKL